jgi:hypothetical protein
MFCFGSQVHISGLHLSFVIPLHKSILFGRFVAVFVGVVGFADVPPKKNHALKRMIAAGINILNTIFFTNLYWKLRVDDIFAILLYILPDILFSGRTIFKQLNTSYRWLCSLRRVELSYQSPVSHLLHRLDQLPPC